jgi:hypothetical protein
MNTIKLLALLLSNIYYREARGISREGLCGHAFDLSISGKISVEERKYLDTLIKNNVVRTKLWKIFRKPYHISTNTKSRYYWDKQDIKSRIKYVNWLIKKYKNEIQNN